MGAKSLKNVIIVLVGTKHPGNVGSAARAMNNMGLNRLRLAAPQCSIDAEAMRMAKAGNEILSDAQVFDSLKSALKGIRLAIGTTGKLVDTGPTYLPLAPSRLKSSKRPPGRRS